MSTHDLSTLLGEWPYEHGRINVRRIKGNDGRPRIQIRMPLGVMQLEVEGRPDGQRPEGFESLLDYQLDRLRRYIDNEGVRDGFVLSPAECSALREEAMMYYHRYAANFVLEAFDNVIDDTTRNLRALDLCRDHAAEERDRFALEQFRPYILTMRTRAAATKAINHGRSQQAISAIDKGIGEIRAALEAIGLGDGAEQSIEIQLLRGMKDALVPKLPSSQRVEIKDRLRAALAAENYELAAILRDELRMLPD